MEANLAKGLYRDGDWAQISYAGQSIPITRTLYEDEGHIPPFDALPTKEEFERQEDDGA